MFDMLREDPGNECMNRGFRVRHARLANVSSHKMLKFLVFLTAVMQATVYFIVAVVVQMLNGVGVTNPRSGRVFRQFYPYPHHGGKASLLIYLYTPSSRSPEMRFRHAKTLLQHFAPRPA